MRAILTPLVVVGGLAGCGRLGFDEVAHLDDASPLDDANDASIPSTVYMTSGDNANPTRLMTIDLANGQFTDLGSLGLPYTFGGLAYWDANTLYGSGNGELIEITLSPLGAQVVRTIGGNVSAFERDGNELIGIDQTNNTFVRFPVAGVLIRTPVLDAQGIGVPASGGDIAHMSDGSWRWWSNSRTQLYRLDVMTARAVEVGPKQTSVPFVSGIARDDGDRLFLVSNGDNSLNEIDPDTGQLGASTPLCLSVPMQPCTAFTLLSGDATRTP